MLERFLLGKYFQESKENVDLALRTYVRSIYKQQNAARVGILCDILEALVEISALPAK